MSLSIHNVPDREVRFDGFVRDLSRNMSPVYVREDRYPKLATNGDIGGEGVDQQLRHQNIINFYKNGNEG